MPVDRRIPRLTPGFHRAKQRLGIVTGTPRGQAVSATIRAVAAAAALPEAADFEAVFHPGRAYVRRVVKQNLWLWFRIDETHVTFVSLTDAPPAPVESE